MQLNVARLLKTAYEELRTIGKKGILEIMKVRCSQEDRNCIKQNGFWQLEHELELVV